MEMRGYEVAQKYVRYRYKRELARAKTNTTDNGILALINQVNEEVNQGELEQESGDQFHPSATIWRERGFKDLTCRVLLPEDIVAAHEEGIIHFHDSDYFAQKEHNCDLVNLEDMLQNGTVISETMIDKPYLPDGLQYRDADHRAGCLQPAWRADLYAGAPVPICSGKPYPPAGAGEEEPDEAGLEATTEQINRIAEDRLEVGDLVRHPDDPVPADYTDDLQRAGPLRFHDHVPG